MKWLLIEWRKIRRNREADRRGWGSIGRMYANGSCWTPAKLRCEIRRSNRLYRLAHGKTPWHPVNGF